MITIRLIILWMFSFSLCQAQFTTDPALPAADQMMTLTVDVTGTPLEGYSDDVWIWAWIESEGTDSDAPTNVNPATDDQSDALMTRSSSNENSYSIQFIPTDFFGVDSDQIDEMGFLLKGRDWSDGQTTDYNIDILSGQFEVKFIAPAASSILVDEGESIGLVADASEATIFTLTVDGTEIFTTSSAALQFTYTLTAALGGIHLVEIKADNGDEMASDTFCYTIRSQTVNEVRPSGVLDGINYHESTDQVTLSLWAPNKESVYIVGDFNDWNIDPEFQMKRDGEHFWLEIHGLAEGQEYAYQYLVDEAIWIADPYADKILDPDDIWIADATYPNLMDYPEGAFHEEWYENRASVLQTGQQPYFWANPTFDKPEKQELVIYELLVRDFLGEENMNYQALIDTLDYIEKLGVNAIELMPIMEFNGNDSWGYNPAFMFAVDKVYGTKNDLKEFIDEAHGRGIAVILDMVMNQNDIPAPFAQMYFDFDLFQPSVDNPWFNPVATHPFNVFSDINHESSYTKTWLDSINYYWIHEYHFDGYRFDLSKGFTQTVSGDNVSLWSQKDQSRIDLLTRMADQIWSHAPDAYVILEHFADNEEEKILADYGMLLWGNSSHDFNDANIGLAEGNSVSWAYHEERNWEEPNLISYMESHDEERQMYELLERGDSEDDYDLSDLKFATERLKMSAAIFFHIPGPKMLWQWGEFGYDVSIDENGRTGRKPTRWEYLTNPYRANLLNAYREIINLKNRYDVFRVGDFSWQPEGEVKTIHISNQDTSVVIAANYAMKQTTVNPEFPHVGTWYDFFTGDELEILSLTDQLIFDPGEFHIYTNHKLHQPKVDLVLDIIGKGVKSKSLLAYPNPVSDVLHVEFPESGKLNGVKEWSLVDMSGQVVMRGVSSFDQISVDMKAVDHGFYLFRYHENHQCISRKIIIQ